MSQPAPLLFLCGIVNDSQFKVLKDDGCNTNILSSEFVKRNRKLLNVSKTFLNIEHSDDNFSENASEVVLDVTIQIGKHQYRYN